MAIDSLAILSICELRIVSDDSVSSEVAFCGDDGVTDNGNSFKYVAMVLITFFARSVGISFQRIAQFGSENIVVRVLSFEFSRHLKMLCTSDAVSKGVVLFLVDVVVLLVGIVVLLVGIVIANALFVTIIEEIKITKENVARTLIHDFVRIEFTF